MLGMRLLWTLLLCIFLLFFFLVSLDTNPPHYALANAGSPVAGHSRPSRSSPSSYIRASSWTVIGQSDSADYGFSLIALLSSALHRAASNPSASLCVATIVASVVVSSAGSTRRSRSASMSTLSSTRKVTGRRHAIVATLSFVSGSRCALAVPTARVLAVLRAALQFRSTRRKRSARRMLGWAALLRALAAAGTGAPSKCATRLTGSYPVIPLFFTS